MIIAYSGGNGFRQVDVGIFMVNGNVVPFLANWCMLQDSSHADEHAQIKVDIQALLPAPIAIGLFEVLTPRDPRLSKLLSKLQAELRQHPVNPIVHDA